jgi:DNA invertase Pin-like site-specific DNA recombinase
MPLIGYARVSTYDQNLEMQKDALEKAGCVRIFEDKVSGVKEKRAGLEAVLDYLREGDTLVVWKLDRLGRSTQDLLKIVNEIRDKGIEFKSLQESIDTSTSGGKLIFHIFASLAEFERDVIRERTLAGITAARARGRVGGRPRKLSVSQIALIKKLHFNNDTSIQTILDMFKIKRRTLYKYLNDY